MLSCQAVLSPPLCLICKSLSIVSQHHTLMIAPLWM